MKNLKTSSKNTVPQTNKAKRLYLTFINYYYRLASAGTGQIVFDMPPTDKIEIPDIPEYKKVDCAIGVNGNSMGPEFSNGDILLIEMTEETETIPDSESKDNSLSDAEIIENDVYNGTGDTVLGKSGCINAFGYDISYGETADFEKLCIRIAIR